MIKITYQYDTGYMTERMNSSFSQFIINIRGALIPCGVIPTYAQFEDFFSNYRSPYFQVLNKPKISRSLYEQFRKEIQINEFEIIAVCHHLQTFATYIHENQDYEEIGSFDRFSKAVNKDFRHRGRLENCFYLSETPGIERPGEIAYLIYGGPLSQAWSDRLLEKNRLLKVSVEGYCRKKLSIDMDNKDELIKNRQEIKAFLIQRIKQSKRLTWLLKHTGSASLFFVGSDSLGVLSKDDVWEYENFYGELLVEVRSQL